MTGPKYTISKWTAKAESKEKKEIEPLPDFWKRRDKPLVILANDAEQTAEGDIIDLLACKDLIPTGEKHETSYQVTVNHQKWAQEDLTINMR